MNPAVERFNVDVMARFLVSTGRRPCHFCLRCFMAIATDSCAAQLTITSHFGGWCEAMRSKAEFTGQSTFSVPGHPKDSRSAT